ncbi:MAG TPA: hypothetical protein VD905_09965 [Flavobacteriales bacterium]|nr:hypothetical protein [Flavobacteriales bacterium]
MRFFKPTYLVVMLIAAVLVQHAAGVKNPRVTSWDCFGYYLVLPQTFVNGDPGNSNLDKVAAIAKKYDLTPTLYQVHSVPNGNFISQYPLGMAVFYMPAFITGHVIAKTGGYEADGFSPPYQYALIWFEVVYVLLSFVFLRKILLYFFNEILATALMLVCFFGTNYYISVINATGMPHQYLFLMYVLLIYFTIKWHKTPSRASAFYIGLILGLMAITRPTDALAFLIPFLWGVKNGKELKDKFRLLFGIRLPDMLMLSLGIFICVFMQMLYWKIYAGQFLHYSYKNQREIFELLHPDTLNFLFSFRKGWFLYTPVMFIATVGLVYAWRKKTEYGLAFLVFTVLTVYVLSSWSCWWYAASFGQRSMVQSYPVYLIALGFLLQMLFARFRVGAWVLSFFILCFIGLNQFQTWQINRGILRLDRMTKDFYLASFTKTKRVWGVDTLLIIDHDIVRSPTLPRKWRYEKVRTYTPERKPDSADVHFVVATKYPELEVKFNVPDMKNEVHAWYKVSFEYKFVNEMDSARSFLIETMVDNHEMGYSWENFPFAKQSEKLNNGWLRFENYYLTPTRVFEGDKFLTGIEYKGTDHILVRNLQVEVYNEKPGWQ